MLELATTHRLRFQREGGVGSLKSAAPFRVDQQQLSPGREVVGMLPGKLPRLRLPFTTSSLIEESKAVCLGKFVIPNNTTVTCRVTVLGSVCLGVMLARSSSHPIACAALLLLWTKPWVAGQGLVLLINHHHRPILLAAQVVWPHEV